MCNIANKAIFWLIHAIKSKKSVIFNQKTQHELKIPGKTQANFAKTQANLEKKLKILSQKLPATEARCLSIPPLCVEKKSLR